MRLGAVMSGLAILVAATTVAAAPEFTGTWINGDGVTASGLKGKLAVLVFYEEG